MRSTNYNSINYGDGSKNLGRSDNLGSIHRGYDVPVYNGYPEYNQGYIPRNNISMNSNGLLN
jgi:hypothetical protein